MLVLSRKRNDSVVIGDEVTVTVERISLGDDIPTVTGATVRLGFQSPRHVSVYRGELCHRRRQPSYSSRPPRKRPEGRVVDISDAEVRLRIQVPRKIPVTWNGAKLDVAQRDEGKVADVPTSTIHHVTCRRNDRITICHNITIAMLDIRRLIPE